MGMEVSESKVPVVEPASEAGFQLDNDRVNIKFGSHGTDEPLNGDATEIPESNLPKDAADEWPQPMQIHSFYVVRYRTFEDQNLKAKMELAEKELQKKNQARLQIVEKIKAKRAERAQVIAQIRNLSVENKQYRTMMDEKKREMEPLQQALGKLRGASGGRDRGAGLCSSEEELNELIKSLNQRIQHESISLNEEKQILREIRQLEGTREKVIANASERAMIEVSLGEKDVIQDQVKLIGVDLDGVRKEKQLINAKLKRLDDEKLAIDKDISALEDELGGVTEKRDKTFETVKELRKQREDANSPFYQNRTLNTKAKSLAANKDIDAVLELCNAEVENFMSLWSFNKAFREDYIRRTLPSLDMRQLSRDGRLRNPDEKPLLHVEKPAAPETEVKKPLAKQTQKDDVLPKVQVDPPKPEKAKSSKPQKEDKKSEKKKETFDVVEEEEEVFAVEKLPNESPPKEVDEAKLKELKREEEMAKRVQAEERKKKLAEKAAVKAAVKAQKDAEKKLKEREKRARKKAGGSAIEAEEPTETAAEEDEAIEKEETLEIPAPQKNKERKENNIRQRAGRRGLDSLPKAVLKRKKAAANYWMWAAGSAAAAAMAVLLILVAYYVYLR